MTDAAYDAGDLLVKAAAFMAAARALGSTSEEINLAVERIAAEFKTVRSEISSGSNYADRINALETAVTELTQNQAQIATQTPGDAPSPGTPAGARANLTG